MRVGCCRGDVAEALRDVFVSGLPAERSWRLRTTFGGAMRTIRPGARSVAGSDALSTAAIVQVQSGNDTQPWSGAVCGGQAREVRLCAEAGSVAGQSAVSARRSSAGFDRSGAPETGPGRRGGVRKAAGCCTGTRRGRRRGVRLDGLSLCGLSMCAQAAHAASAVPAGPSRGPRHSSSGSRRPATPPGWAHLRGLPLRRRPV